MRPPRYALLATVLLACTPGIHPASAQAPAAHAAAASTVAIEVGGGRVLRTGGAIANLFASDPKVAEVRPASNNSIFIFGVGVGRTTIAALDAGGNVLGQYDVVVGPSSYGASAAGGAARTAMPGNQLRFAPTPDGITVSGAAATPAQAEQAAAIARRYVGEKQTVDNRTSVTSSVQVMLRVRIAEISRSITRQLGFNWTYLSNGITGSRYFAAAASVVGGLSQTSNAPNGIGIGYNDGTTSLDTILDLLAQDQLITMLAEPNLTARSGESASFLAGGEFPIPVSSQNNSISVQFKQYGVSLAFVPTVLSDGRISLHVRPEVSELTDVGAVSLPIGVSLLGSSTVTIPALTVRRADTTVELGSGESFAVAGLLSNNTNMNGRGLPYLGEIPVVGALFKSDLFKRGQSELVIVVTPYLVSPVGSPDRIRVPTDGFVPAGDVDRLLLMRQRASGTGPATVIPPSLAAMGPAARLRSGAMPAGTGFILH
ncbi:Type II and III secretion system protein family protein [Rhodovastum atsumiense]|uniref:Type II and III secretion system protein family protein n=1 Tax=Rhodovastum atsumiense TaxID=504468 RepID=A0A5M6IZX3_9PROT|nr:type II and III secretion system protein family protein [Rhodovastum atsumiense]KAA5613896.1 type II and III secretion system protein family protein [Rhodovastum atsumiense]CAH2602022.1 Type II and III secretion system protein family protein [Rhodovastum atsumiense]